MGLAKETSEMKDISRNEEEDGNRRRVFKEEMIRRAEETRSFMMTKSSFGGGNFGRVSPKGSGHQSVIDIKIERENGTDKVKGNEYEVGRENFFKVNIENGSNARNGTNSKTENCDYVEKEIFTHGKDDLRNSFLFGTSGQDKGYNVGGKPGFNVSIENGVKIKIENNFENNNNTSNSAKTNQMAVTRQHNLNNNAGTIDNESEVDSTLGGPNGLMTKKLPTSYADDMARHSPYSELDIQKQDMTMKNGTHQNPGAGSLQVNDVFGPEFGTA